MGPWELARDPGQPRVLQARGLLAEGEVHPPLHRWDGPRRLPDHREGERRLLQRHLPHHRGQAPRPPATASSSPGLTSPSPSGTSPPDLLRLRRRGEALRGVHVRLRPALLLRGPPTKKPPPLFHLFMLRDL